MLVAFTLEIKIKKDYNNIQKKAAITVGSMLKAILEAEKKAREAEIEAENCKASASAEIEKKKKAIIDKKMDEARREVERLRSEHRKAVADSMLSAEKEKSEKEEKLLSLKKEKFTEWTDEIFERVIGDKT